MAREDTDKGASPRLGKDASSTKKNPKPKTGRAGEAPSQRRTEGTGARGSTTTRPASRAKAAERSQDAERGRSSTGGGSRGKGAARSSKGEGTQATGGAKAEGARGRTKSSKGAEKSRSGASQVTTDHDTIRRWIEERGGRPAGVKQTGGGKDPGILRVDFPGVGDEESLDEISWDEFFDKFEEKNLAFLYQERMKSGKESRFFKFVSREE